MTICSSCEGEVEATGQCLRCGYGQPKWGLAANDSPAATQEFRAIPPQTADLRVYLAAVAAAVAAEADAEAADTGEAEGNEAEEKGGLIRTYHARRIRIKDLKSPVLKRVMWVAIAQIAIVTLLMAVQKVHQPQVNSAVPGAIGGTFVVPLAAFIVMVISIAAGYWFGLAGAMRVRPSVGIPIAALATWTLADPAISSLRLGSTSIGPQTSYAGLRWAQLGVLAVFWIWLGGTTAARRRAQGKKPVVAPDPAGQPWHRRTFQGALACVLAYYALEFAVWVLYARAGLAATGTGSLLEDLGVQSVLLPTFLILVVLLGSTDLLGWGEIAVRWVVVRAKHAQPPRLLMILTPLAALAMIANVLRLDGVNALLELAVIGVPTALVALFVRLVSGYGGWSDDIRSRAVVTGAVVTFVYITIILNITSAIRSAIGWSFHFDYRFYSLVSTPIALAALTTGLFLLANPGIGKPEQRGRGLLLVIVGVLIVIAGLPAFLNTAHLPAVFPQQHYSLLPGLQLVAALGTLGWLISLVLRKCMKKAVVQLATVLTLLAGLQIVSWVLDLLNAIIKLGADSDYLLAALFFLPVIWGFATSGDNLTGTKANTAAYPRDGRILLTVSYTLVSNATLLYLGALRVPATGAGPPSYLTADPVTPLGLAVLGSALVIVAFVTKMTSGPANAAAPTTRDAAARQADPAPRRPSGGRVPARSYNAVQIGIVGVGAVATGAALVILGSTLPRLTQANAALLREPYAASVPGPGCDARGALWTVTPGEPVTTACGRTGLRVGIGPGPITQGDVKFQPPNGFASQNYRISVRIAFSSGFQGCAGIFTRASAAGRYLTDVCSDDSVGIDKLGAHGTSLIYLGFIRQALTYTIAAVSRGSDQSVYIDGNKIGTVANAAFFKTEYIGLEILNRGDAREAAIFHNFSFTPLSASPRTR